MNLQKIAAISTLACAGLLFGPDIHAQAAAPAGGKSVTPKEITWGANPALPKGTKAVLLAGDPDTGASVVRVKIAANVKIMPHSHTTANQVTVLSGTVLYGEGDKFDARKLKAYPAGSFIIETPNSPHFLTAKGPAEFQVSIPGKQSFDYVDPKDDPRKK